MRRDYPEFRLLWFAFVNLQSVGREGVWLLKPCHQGTEKPAISDHCVCGRVMEIKGQVFQSQGHSTFSPIKGQDNMVCATLRDTGLQSSDEFVDLVGSASWLYGLRAQWSHEVKWQSIWGNIERGKLWTCLVSTCIPLRWKKFILTHCIQKFNSMLAVRISVKMISMYRYLQTPNETSKVVLQNSFWSDPQVRVQAPAKGMQTGVREPGCHFRFLSCKDAN